MSETRQILDHGVDPITVEIIRHALISIPDQIELNIARTAFSPLIHTYKDYAVGMVDPEGRLIAQARAAIPIFVANALSVAVRDGLAIYGREGIEPGDIIFTNHAGTLGQHLNNVAMYTPVFVGPDQKDLAGFMAVLVHWIDIGGAVPGSCSVSGDEITELAQEGIQFRTIKLWSRGKPVQEIYRIIEYNTRFRRMLMGDIDSQVAGCLRGREMFAALVAKYGLATIRGAIETIWDQSEAASQAAIRKIPDGVYEAGSFADDDGVDRGRPVPIKVAVRVQGDAMTVDFTGVGAQTRGPINSGREGGAVVAARVAFKYLVAPDEPVNDGSFRPLRVEIPDGTFLSANDTAAMGGYSTILPTVVDTIVKAMTPAIPDQVTGGHQGNLGSHTVDGWHPKTGERFQTGGSSHGGWGASLGHDGPYPFKTMTHGDTQDVPVEVQEALYPVRILSQLLAEDSGGAGEFRGGLGLDKLVTALSPSTISIGFDRSRCPPWGILGGQDGRAPTVFVEKLDQEPQLVLKGRVALEPGDRVYVHTPGGGGYGQPLLRESWRVARDVRLGYISETAARDIYGVVLDSAGEVLEHETRRRRAEHVKA